MVYWLYVLSLTGILQSAGSKQSLSRHQVQAGLPLCCLCLLLPSLLSPAGLLLAGRVPPAGN